MSTARRFTQQTGGAAIDEADREVTRLNLALPAGTRERLNALQRDTGAPTITDTITRALRVYEWLVQQERNGRELLVREPGKEPTLVKFVY